jgi:hypothetical protein
MTESNKTLDEKVRESLIKDYLQVQRVIQEHLFDNSPNFLILKENYLIPETDPSQVLSMNDMRSRFKYFCRVRNVLEFALNNGYIPKDVLLPKGSPEYLTTLKNVSRTIDGS